MLDESIDLFMRTAETTVVQSATNVGVGFMLNLFTTGVDWGGVEPIRGFWCHAGAPGSIPGGHSALALGYRAPTHQLNGSNNSCTKRTTENAVSNCPKWKAEGFCWFSQEGKYNLPSHKNHKARCDTRRKRTNILDRRRHFRKAIFFVIVHRLSRYLKIFFIMLYIYNFECVNFGQNQLLMYFTMPLVLFL